MKKSIILLLTASALSLNAQNVFTIPQGYTKITIAGASGGDPQFTALSSTLMKDVEYSGAVTLGSFSAGTGSQTLTVSGVTWTADQWTSEPYLAYVQGEDTDLTDNLGGPEMAFLVQGNTTSGSLTLSTNADISTLIANPSSVKIRKATTLKTLFSSSEDQIFGADRLYVFNTATRVWDSFRFQNNWINIKKSELANDMVIFPDEGMIYQRSAPGDIVLTVFGEVASSPQLASIQGMGFMSTRVAVETTLGTLSIQDSSWQPNDRVYIWNRDANPPAWQSHRYLTNATTGESFWLKISTSERSTDDLIPGDSAVFVLRASDTSPSNGAIEAKLPYDPFAQ